MSTQVLSVRVSDDVKARLDALSAATGRSRSYYVQEALLEHLEDMEWAYDIASRAESIRRGDRSTRTFDEVAADLSFDPDELRDEVTESHAVEG